jgi:hypothetical protein
MCKTYNIQKLLNLNLSQCHQATDDENREGSCSIGLPDVAAGPRKFYWIQNYFSPIRMPCFYNFSRPLLM